MASNLSPEDIKVLEQTRQRLSQLTNSLSSLQRDLIHSDPLPSWSNLTSISSIISSNLVALSALLAEHRTLLTSCAAFPLPSFPGRTHEALLEQLLRKKLEPGVEDWAEAGRDLVKERGLALDTGKRGVGNGLSQNGIATGAVAGSLTVNEAKKQELQELWEWAGGQANSLARREHWGADYTRDEVNSGVEKVQTGLKRKLRVPKGIDEDDDSDEDDDEDDDEDGDVEMEPALQRVEVRRNSMGQGGVEIDITEGSGNDRKGGWSAGEQWRFMMTGRPERIR